VFAEHRMPAWRPSTDDDRPVGHAPHARDLRKRAPTFAGTGVHP
jgi:hypothetical protein